MIACLGLVVALSAPSPLTKTRAYEAFLRPPAALWNGAWGTVDAYRYQLEHKRAIAAWPNPTDAQTQDFGVVDTSVSTVSIAEPDEGSLVVTPDNFGLHFDGVDDAVSLPSVLGASTWLNGVQTFTVEALVNHDSTGGANGGIFEKTVANAVNTQFLLFLQAGNLNWRVTPAAAAYQTVSVAWAPFENDFHHVAGTYDGQVMRLHIDGAQVGTFDFGAPTAVATGVGAGFIASLAAAGFSFKGVIDDVRVWSVARSAGEIAENMRKRLTGKERNLVSYWALDDGAGLVALDKMATGNSGNLTNGPTWTAGAPTDARAEFAALQSKLRDQLVDLELVTRVTREDGSTVELINERRCTVKKVTRKPGVLSIDIADVDRSALDALYPSKTYTTTDWPELYQDHVGRVVPQGMGTVEKVPLTWVVKTGGLWKYAACEIPAGYGMPTVLAAYRDKKFVSAVEYGTATQVVNGVNHFLLTFTKEQIDGSGNVYTMEADILYPGSRYPSDEIMRLILLSGGAVDTQSFMTAAAWCRQIGLFIDAPYSTQQTYLKGIQDLLTVCRAQLFKTPAGTWRIFMDVPRDVAMIATAKEDELWVEELSFPEVPKTVTLQYRMSSNDKGDLELTGKISRNTTGTGKEELWASPVVRDHGVADIVLSYLTKRRQNRADAKGYVLGQQLDVGDLVALEAPTVWTDRLVLAAPSVQRSPDRNDLVMSLYNDDTYVYTAGTLRTDASNTYKPDYSQTVPGDPSGASITQNVTFEAIYTWQPAVDPGNRALLYVVEDNFTGSFVEVFRGTVTSFQRTGLSSSGSITFRVKAIVVENTALQSGYATSSAFAYGKTIGDSFIPGGGISGGSIANSSINRGRSYTSTGSGSTHVADLSFGAVGMDYYTFYPSAGSSLGNLVQQPGNLAPVDDLGTFSVRCTTTGMGGDNLSVDWRKFNS